MNKSLAESLNFSDRKRTRQAIKIYKWQDVNFYETLALYCAENDIDLNTFKHSDIDSTVHLMASFGQNDQSSDHYFFWIDQDVQSRQGDFSATSSTGVNVDLEAKTLVGAKREAAAWVGCCGVSVYCDGELLATRSYNAITKKHADWVSHGGVCE